MTYWRYSHLVAKVIFICFAQFRKPWRLEDTTSPSSDTFPNHRRNPRDCSNRKLVTKMAAVTGLGHTLITVCSARCQFTKISQPMKWRATVTWQRCCLSCRMVWITVRQFCHPVDSTSSLSPGPSSISSWSR